MVTYAACYPGQGAQRPQMALDLFRESSRVRRLFEIASEVAKVPMYDLLEHADETALKQTEITQLAVTLANRSATVFLEERGVRFGCHAGFSLGELSAYAAAEVITDETLFDVVAKRGRLMARASQDAESRFGKLGMAAVMGLGFAEVERILIEQRATHLYAANDNGPKQVVISGLGEEIERCTAALKDAGARRIVSLSVSGPFHTPLMQEAEVEFADYLTDIFFADPKSLLYTTVTGAPVATGAEVRALCARQLSSPVRWTSIMEHIVQESKLSEAVEPGPGSVLCGLWRSGGFPVSCSPAGTYEDIQKVLNEGENHA